MALVKTEPDGPLFVLSAARSGSTLLRVLLDSHSELACPQELNLSDACWRLCFAWNALELSQTTETALRSLARIQSRQVYESLMALVLRDSGKKRWCDKSLSSAGHADMLHEVFPEARFICLYRHPMDVVASAIEASTWGYRHYGLSAYVQANPSNFVAAILMYWQDVTGSIVAFETRHPEICVRLRYEDLVHEPEKSVRRLCDFAGLAWEPDLVERAFTTAHSQGGFGDQKIWYTSSVSAKSVGRGRSVPIAQVPPGLFRSLNTLLWELDYPDLTGWWNKGGSVGIPSRDGGLPTKCAECRVTETEIAGVVRRHLADSQREMPIEMCSLLVDDRPQACCGRWTVNAKNATVEPTGADHELAPYILRCDSAILRALLKGEDEVVLALGSGRLMLSSLEGAKFLGPREVRTFLQTLFGRELTTM
ncbi:MAG TPA: sulfotransferase [Acidimicrobiales bacterium]|jgi:hypothetical protein|nr:sulfotransferase [Acidimicrobiales bacterium]